MSKLKICGLTRPEDMQAVNEAGPDYIGFVFAKSRRQVSAQQAGQLRALLRDGIQAVGVFVNAPVEEIEALCRAGVIDIVQLHGDEGAEYIAALRALVKNPIIKAVRVQSAEDIHRARTLDCDYLLLDAFDKSQYGGSGKTFDWSVIDRLEKPWFLAGGLQLDNVAQAAATGAYALDISSGVETDGVKDREKILAVTRRIRSLDNHA